MPDLTEVTLPPAALRRIVRLRDRAEGASAVAQAAMQAAQQAHAALQAGLTEACEEEGMVIPQNGNAPVDLDWRTGKVSLTLAPMPPQGLPLPEGFNGGLPIDGVRPS